MLLNNSRRLIMLLDNRNMGVGQDGLSRLVGDIVSNVGLPLQAGGPIFLPADTYMLMKVLVTQLIFSSSVWILQFFL